MRNWEVETSWNLVISRGVAASGVDSGCSSSRGTSFTWVLTDFGPLDSRCFQARKQGAVQSTNEGESNLFLLMVSFLFLSRSLSVSLFPLNDVNSFEESSQPDVFKMFTVSSAPTGKLAQ